MTGVFSLVFMAVLVLCMAQVTNANAFVENHPPSTPAVDYVVPLATQPFSTDPDVIWYDSFDAPNAQARYMEFGHTSGTFTQVSEEALGGSGQSLRAQFHKGTTEAGGLKLTFGDWPAGGGPQARPGEKFTTIYWRHYIKHQTGWQGNPAKLSRATSITGSNWAQAMIAHVWGGPGNVLTLDPASGIAPSGEQVTTRYNDFDHLRWLGNRPAGQFPLFATEESGKWVCVEAAVKLNTPGVADGTFYLWIDGKLDAMRTGLSWTGTWNELGINAIFLENYWNDGSPVEQMRYFDDFVVSTKPIGLARSSVQPEIVKNHFQDPDTNDKQTAWQVQVATDEVEPALVWDSGVIVGAGNNIVVNTVNGEFQGSLAGYSALLPDTRYVVRVRQCDSAGVWSDWSAWRLVIHTGAATTQ